MIELLLFSLRIRENVVFQRQALSCAFIVCITGSVDLTCVVGVYEHIMCFEKFLVSFSHRSLEFTRRMSYIPFA